LRYFVEQTLDGNADKLSEFVLALEVFHKKETFDPRIDSIVRVKARRLRKRLDKYYREEGRDDPIVIGFRMRSFVPEFRERSVDARLSRVSRHWRPSRRKAFAISGVVVGVISRIFRPTPRSTGGQASTMR